VSSYLVSMVLTSFCHQVFARLNRRMHVENKSRTPSRFDVFKRLEDNRVQFLGTMDTLEEADELARTSYDEGQYFVLHTTFGVSSKVRTHREELELQHAHSV